MSKKKLPIEKPKVISPNANGTGENGVHNIALDGLYQNWFLDYDWLTAIGTK